MYSPKTGADTLDQYIAKLQSLRDKHGGNCKVIVSGGDYPEAATGPRYVDKQQANAYVPEGTVLLA